MFRERLSFQYDNNDGKNVIVPNENVILHISVRAEYLLQLSLYFDNLYPTVLSIHFDCDHSLVTFQLLGYLWGILDNTKSSRSWQLSEAPF
jgi:hypothetical protein